MSLVKQLWLAILVVMAVAFGGSLVVSVLSARHYLEQQLQVKNYDNATALALALTQLDKDPVTLELQVSAQFDVGHYKFIRVTSPTGEVLVEKVYEGPLEGAPQWFARLIPIRTTPGKPRSRMAGSNSAPSPWPATTSTPTKACGKARSSC